MKVHFGHCVSCDQAIRPPHLSLKVMQAIGNGDRVTEWEEIDVCNDCAAKLTAKDLHRLVSADEVAAA